MKKILCLLILISPTIFSNQVVHSASSKVIINELMPNPKGTDTGNEWIELYNNSTEDVLLTGWKIKDKTNSFSLDGLSISAKSYLVIFPTISLNNSDEIITLVDSLDYKDEIIYASSSEGISLERINPNCTDLKAHTSNHTQGLINLNFDENFCQNSHKLTIYTREKGTTSWNEDHSYFLNNEIETKVETNSDANAISTQWKFNGKDFNAEEASFILTSVQLESPLSVTVSFDNNTTLNSSVNIKIDPVLKLNEIFPDPDGPDTGKEWIEIYNPNSFDIELKNWSVKVGNKAQIIEEGAIKSKSFFIILPSYSLTNSGTTISLISPNGLISDNFTYDHSESGLSWVRNINGEGDWIISSMTKESGNLIVIKEESITKDSPNKQHQNIFEDFSPELNFPVLHKSGVTNTDSIQSTTDLWVKHIDFKILIVFFTIELFCYVLLILDNNERMKIWETTKRFVKG